MMTRSPTANRGMHTANAILYELFDAGLLVVVVVVVVGLINRVDVKVNEDDGVVSVVSN